MGTSYSCAEGIDITEKNKINFLLFTEQNLHVLKLLTSSRKTGNLRKTACPNFFVNRIACQNVQHNLLNIIPPIFKFQYLGLQ